MYKQIDTRLEISNLKKYRLCAWSGKKQKYLTVTVEKNGEKYNLKYYFSNTKEYSSFNMALRRLEEEQNS